WVEYVSHWLFLITLVVFCVTVSVYGWTAMSWSLKALFATNTQTVNIAEPIKVDYIGEYINDFCYTEGFSERALAMRRSDAAAKSPSSSSTTTPTLEVVVDADG